MLSALIAMSLLAPQPVLAGYLPAWRTAKYDFSRLAPLTDVLYFSIQPTVEGGLNLKDINMANLPRLAEAKKKYGFRLLICAGGWERGEGFVPTASDPAKTARFVRESLAFCDKHGFDGIDLDWEHPKTPAEGKLYGELIQALRT
ncbi:MAG TPA: glycoside hydrolase family 18 protein, partial [Usitatibacter sp.]|nr:glycoside hydrolase family 18 protein [Usitatibacter sp.]